MHLNDKESSHYNVQQNTFVVICSLRNAFKQMEIEINSLNKALKWIIIERKNVDQDDISYSKNAFIDNTNVF